MNDSAGPVQRGFLHRAFLKLRPSTWVGIVLGGLWLVVSLASSGVPGVIVGAGTVTAFTAIYVLISGRKSWMMLPSRKAGALLLAGAVVASFAGAALAPQVPPTPAGIHLADSSERQGTETASPAATDKRDTTPTSRPTSRKPVITIGQAQEVTEIPFDMQTVDDPNLSSGTTQIVSAGAAGQRTVTYRVTLTDGKETAREVVSDVVTVAPVAQVTANGTYVAPPPAAAAPSGCDPNYGGACVPIASDVDCAGGSGNGPAYVSGPVTVVGWDIYDLDRDGDGIACD